MKQPRQLIDAMGRYCEGIGVPRIGGRMLGYVLAAENAVTMEDMARDLGVSRASVSTNVRVLELFGLIEEESVAGDRNRHYRFHPQAWARHLDGLARQSRALRAVAKLGLREVPASQRRARERLRQTTRFCDLVEGELSRLAQRWVRQSGGTKHPKGEDV